jgi:pimeloyl-ACP methyl ester carboxylesterase
MTSMMVGGVGGGEARLVHAIPRVALVILGVAAFHRVEVLDEVIPGGLHQIAGQQGDDHPLARHGAPTALVSRRSRRLPSGLRSDHWPIVIGDFIELFGDAHSEDFPDLQELERISTPILLVHGDRDHHFAPEIACALYRKLPSAELCVLPNTGHWPPSEQPEIFNLLAADFLTRTGEPFGSCRVVPREDPFVGT